MQMKQNVQNKLELKFKKAEQKRKELDKKRLSHTITTQYKLFDNPCDV